MIYQNLLLNLILPAADMAAGTRYKYYLKLFRDLSKFSREDIEKWQNEKIKKLVRHCYENVPFYTEFMRDNNIRPEDIKNAEDLKVFPVLTKEFIKENFEKFIPSNLTEYRYKTAATGGSTGVPMKYYVSYKAQSAIWAKRIFVLSKFGYSFGDRYLALGSSSIIPGSKEKGASKYFHKLTRVIPLNAASMNKDNCETALAIIRKYKLKMIYGYASSVYLLAKYVLDNSIDIKLKICMTTSEKLTEHYESTIKKAFGCTVIDEYGDREAGIYSYKCPEGLFHMIETCVFYTENDQKRGEITATNLVNFAMPFINFNVKDVITLHDSICSCGSNTRTFKDILGRSSEVIELSNGNVITGPAFTILFSKLPVKTYQIAKTGDKELEIRIEKGEGFTDETENTIINSFVKYAGKEIDLKFNYKYEFKLLPSGKRNYFVNS
ncbi:MAG TPA: hypothetical protein PLK90_06055 [Clostridiales bacterium]|nr:hypothetical protein [Clostridiales bacterium]HQP69945.1 hypothetical protein [Clostridiales bacterium]